MSTYKCTYCDVQNDSRKPMIEHLILAHDTHVISYQETILEQDTGNLVVTTKSTNIKPCDHLIILDETFRKISIEVKCNFPFNPNKKQKLDTKTDHLITNSSSVPVISSPNNYLPNNTPKDKDLYNELQEYILPCFNKLHSEGKSHSLLNFIKLIANGRIPTDNIVILLLWDLVQWFDCEDTRAMRYSPETKLFWRTGWKIFKTKFISFMSGFKNGNNTLDVEDNTLSRSFHLKDSNINFAIPDIIIIQDLDSPVVFSQLQPGIIHKMVDIVQKYGVGKAHKLCVDGFAIEFYNGLKEAIAKCTGKLVNRNETTIVNPYMVQEKDIPSFTPPENLIIDRLTLADSPQVHSEWDYAKVKNNSDIYVSWLIENRPSMAVREKDGTLIAYELIHYPGPFGLLYVKPQYRGKGIAKYIITEMARRRLKTGHDAFVYIQEDNSVSKHVHIKCGFKKLDNCIFWLNNEGNME